jgi:prepilin-type N-terminal cleavage/methylation domain-containing protein
MASPTGEVCVRSSGSVRPEDGFTLIELLASVVVLVIGITAVAQVFNGTLRANGSADVRTRATSIAGREIEAMRSQPYASVGLPSGSVGATWTDPLDNGVYNAVFVSGSSISPTGSDVAGAVPVTIQRMIVWVASNPNNQAYKRVVALVSWTDAAGTHTVRQDSDVYPGGLGPYGSTTTTALAMTSTLPLLPGAPTNLTATQDPTNETSQIDLAWTAGSPAATTWEIQHSLDNTFTSYTEDTSTQPGSSTTYIKTGLAAKTTFWFRVRALDSQGAASAWSTYASAATANAGPTCTIGTANATPAAQARGNNGNGHLTSSIYVQVHTSGNCSSLSLVFMPGVSQGQVTTSLVPESGEVFDYTIGIADYSWDVGNKSIIVEDEAQNVLATIALTICSKGASTCP